MQESWNFKKENNSGESGVPASKISRMNKLKTLGLAALSTLAGMNVNAQAQKTLGNAPSGTQNERTTEDPKYMNANPADMQYYKNVTENGEPMEALRFTDIQNGDTVVRNIFPSKIRPDVYLEIQEVYGKDKSRGSASEPKRPEEIRVDEAGDTTEEYQTINPKTRDTIRYTKLIPNALTAKRKNAPKNLGEVNSEIPMIKESNAFTGNSNTAIKIKRPDGGPWKTPRIITTTRVAKSPRPDFGDAANPDMATGEESIPLKMREIFRNGIGPDLEEMTGNSRDFINHNTMRFYRWIKDSKNWRRMDIGTWGKVQAKLSFLESKMDEVQSWENGGGPHDPIDFRTDPNFLFVKRMMAENPATLDQAMENWKSERENEREKTSGAM